MSSVRNKKSLVVVLLTWLQLGTLFTFIFYISIQHTTILCSEISLNAVNNAFRKLFIFKTTKREIDTRGFFMSNFFSLYFLPSKHVSISVMLESTLFLCPAKHRRERIIIIITHQSNTNEMKFSTSKKNEIYLLFFSFSGDSQNFADTPLITSRLIFNLFIKINFSIGDIFNFFIYILSSRTQLVVFFSYFFCYFVKVYDVGNGVRRTQFSFILNTFFVVFLRLKRLQ